VGESQISKEAFLEALLGVRSARVVELEESNALQQVMIAQRDARIADLEGSKPADG